VKEQFMVKRLLFVAFTAFGFGGTGEYGLGQSPELTIEQRSVVQRKLEELVIVREGELPILISAPHGGTHSIVGVEPREGKGMETGPKGFFTGRDGGTQELAEEVVIAIGKKFGKKPFAVISATHRKYLDPNRPPSIAYEDVDAKPVYDRYHGAMSRFAKQIMNEMKHGLLLDIHGQGTSRETVYRGTSNGKTVERLKQRFGEQAHIGEQSLFGLLKKQGWKVYPDPFDEREKSGFTGGFIVQTYGSHNAIGIDAVQLELGAEYRTTGAREKIASQIAEAVFEYSQLYLLPEKLSN
jgi:N-formylglutamate amidohydrolase